MGFEDAQVFAIGGARLHTLTAALESELSIRGAGPERWLATSWTASKQKYPQVLLHNSFKDVSDEQVEAFCRHSDAMPAMATDKLQEAKIALATTCVFNVLVPDEAEQGSVMNVASPTRGI